MRNPFCETPKLSQMLTVTESRENMLAYPTSEGVGLLDFTLYLIYDGTGLLDRYNTLDINNLTVNQQALEASLVKNVSRSQNILLIAGIHEKKRIKKLFQGRLLSSQEIVVVAPKADWFYPENNKLATLIGGSNTGDTPIDEMLKKELPCKIPPVERQKIAAYIRAKGLHYKTLAALANSLWLYTRKIGNRGVNDAILSKRFHW